MQKSQLNLLTILFQPEAFSRPYACCSAASRIEANTFYIGTFIERYKLYNGASGRRGRPRSACQPKVSVIPAAPKYASVRGEKPFRSAASRRPDGFGKKTSRPVSRVLSWTVIPLGLTSPSGSSNLPGSSAGHANAPLFGLAPSGVCHATRRCPRARCALTAPFHPYHARLATPFGGLFSVALSVGSRRPGVTWHCALWSPDFPRNACAPRDHPADSVGIVPRMRRR